MSITLHRLRGISLLEMLLVISIMAAVIVSTTRYLFSTTLTLSVNQTIDQLQQSVEASYAWLRTAHQADFQGPDKETGTTAISLDKLKQAGLVAATAGQNYWGGAVHILPSTNPAQVEIELDQIPESACLQLAGRMKNIDAPESPGCVGHNQYIGIF